MGSNGQTIMDALGRQYFHIVINKRRVKTKITQLKDEQRIWQNQTATLKQMALSFFQKLYIET